MAASTVSFSDNLQQHKQIGIYLKIMSLQTSQINPTLDTSDKVWFVILEKLLSELHNSKVIVIVGKCLNLNIFICVAHKAAQFFALMKRHETVTQQRTYKHNMDIICLINPTYYTKPRLNKVSCRVQIKPLMKNENE